MHRNEIRQTISTWILEQFRDLAFVKKSGNEPVFQRKIENGWQQLGFVAMGNDLQYHYDFNLTIRYHPAAELFNRFSGVSDRFAKITTTVISSLGYLRNQTPEFSRFQFTDAVTLQRQLRVFELAEVAQMQTFFQQYERLEAINDGVNHKTPSIDRTLDPGGAMNSLILAKLAGDSELNTIYIANRKRLSAHPELLAKLDALYEHLHSSSIGPLG